MENTSNVLFDDDTPQWYLAQGDHWVGPLAASEIHQKVLDREISWAHYVWKPGTANWQRLCDTPAFQVAVPSQPTKQVQLQVKEAAKPGTRKIVPPPMVREDDGEEKIWFLHYSHSQFGPFSFGEVCRYLKIGKIHAKVHAWKEGMEGWAKLETLDEFQGYLPESSGTGSRSVPPKPTVKASTRASTKKEHREALRRPLLAKILMADDNAVTVAVCRDISVGGMQVLTDKIPGPVGARIKLNVSPSGTAGGKRIHPFVAKGVIVRILEDGRGFSFRFDRLTPGAKRAIEEYISSTY